jgi:hypothetical protein
LDTYDFLADPRAITLDERRATAARMHREQQGWLERLQALAEPPKPGKDFPAYLLATPTFADLAQRLGTATQRSQLPTDVADELDWFVQAFAGYLRTCDGEDAFAPAGNHDEAH